MPLGARRQLTFFPDRSANASWPRHAPTTSCSPRTSAATSSARSTATTSPTGAITLLTRRRTSQQHARRRGRTAATGSPTPRRGATAPTATSTSWTRRPDARPAACWRSRAAAGRRSTGRRTTAKLLVERVRLGQRELLWLRGRGDRREDARSRRRPGRAGRLRAARSSAATARACTSPPTATRVPAPRLHRLATEGATLPDRATSPGTWRLRRCRPTARRIAFVTNEDGASVLHLLDAATGKELPAPEAAGRRRSAALHWHEQRPRTSAFTLSSARSPADVYSLDVDDRQGRALDRERDRRAQRARASPSRSSSLEELRRPDDLRLPLPAAGALPGPRPVIINIHGGPEGQSRPGFLGRNNYFLNELGVASSIPNVRGSTGYGKTSSQLDNGFEARGLGARTSARCSTGSRRRPDLDADARHGHGRQLRRLHDARRRRRTTTTASAARSTSSASRTSSRSSRTPRLPPRPAPRGVRRRARPGDARVPARASRPLNNARRRSPSRCSSCRARTTRACRAREAEQMVATVEEERRRPSGT